MRFAGPCRSGWSQSGRVSRDRELERGLIPTGIEIHLAMEPVSRIKSIDGLCAPDPRRPDGPSARRRAAGPRRCVGTM